MWQRERLDVEKPIVKEFGLSNKKELWKTSSMLRKFTGQAKRLIALRGEQAEIEKRQLIAKLSSLGIIEKQASLDEVLGLTIKDFLGRRLQTIVLKKNFAHSINQSRQFIVHKHITVNDRIITSPAYLVPMASESNVSFTVSSTLAKADHPERIIKEVVKEEVDVKEEVATVKEKVAVVKEVVAVKEAVKKEVTDAKDRN